MAIDPFDMSDEELERAFLEAKDEMSSGSDEPEIDEIDDTVSDDTVEEDIITEDDEVEEDIITEDDTVEEDIITEDDTVEEEEQPDNYEDSDDDTSTEEESEEDAEEEAEESEEDELDGDSEDDEDEPAEEDSEEDEEVQPEQKYKYKANGREYEFTDDEIKSQFGKVFGQAMDYTKKMQAIKPWRKTIDALEEAQLGHNDINLMIDVLKGDKAAVEEVLRRTGTDALELDTENSKYEPKDYGRDEKTLDLKDVIDEISVDKEYEVTHKVLSKDWDDSSWEQMSSNPEMIRLLHADVKSGMYDTLMPTVEKLKLYDRGSKTDLEYYEMAANMYFADQKDAQAKEVADEQARVKAEAKQAEADRIAAVKAKTAKAKATKEAAAKRRAATPVKQRAAANKVTDYLDDSEEAFDEWYSNLQERM